MAEEAKRGEAAALNGEAAGAAEEPPTKQPAGAGGRARLMRELLAEAHEAPQEAAEHRALCDAVHLIQMHERARQNRIQSSNRESPRAGAERVSHAHPYL